MIKIWNELFSDQSPSLEVEQKHQFEDVLMRIVAAQEGTLNGLVTPETCMQSPTVHSIVTAVSGRMAVTPLHVYKKTMSKGIASKEPLPNHPVARLLRSPNQWQTNLDFWRDATSSLLRHGAFYSYKSRGTTGPIRQLLPIHASSVDARQDENYKVTFRVATKGGASVEYDPSALFHARTGARDFVSGDSPVNDVANTIALEILAEKFGVTFFRNGAMPLLIFNFKEGSAGFQTAEQEQQFIADFQEAFSGGNMHKGMLLPAGLDKPTTASIEHDKLQFLETRKHQRTVIAGAFGVPPHLVGDLTKSTYNNVEQQDQDFTNNVVLPVAETFEAAMERDLLTPADRSAGIVIRFNLDGILRADFKSRQEGLRMQREMGVINANEWREHEGMNPREGGDEYYEQGPSGQNMGNDQNEI
jgi:HK97 family phage portal protein